MVRKTIATFSLFLFVGLASLPLLSGEMICGENCCAAASVAGCKDDFNSCPDMITAGNEALLFPLVSAPLASYHADLTPAVVSLLLSHSSAETESGWFTHHDTAVPPSPAPPQLIPLRI